MGMVIAIALVMAALVPMMSSGQEGDGMAQAGQLDRMEFAPAEGASPGQEEQQMTELLQQAEQKGLFGNFTVTENNLTMVEGRFVSLGLDEQNGVIRNYTIADPQQLQEEQQEGQEPQMIPVIQDLVIQEFQPDGVEVSGSVLSATGQNAAVYAHNSPLGLMRIQGMSENTQIQMNMAQGIQMEQMELEEQGNETQQSVSAMTVTGENINGVLIVMNGEVEMPGQGQQEEDGGVIDDFMNLFNGGGEQSDQPTALNVTLQQDGQVIFRAAPTFAGEQQGEDLSSEENQQSIAQGIAQGDIAGEISMIASQQGLLYSAALYDMEIGPQFSLQNQSSVMMEFAEPPQNGSVFIIYADSESLNITSEQPPTVMVGQESAMSAEGLSNLMDAASAQEDQPQYVMGQTGEVVQIVIYVPQGGSEVTIVGGGAQQGQS